MVKAKVFFLLFFSIMAQGIFLRPQQKDTREETDKLGEILEKTGKYCERLKKVIFDFVCYENITEKVFLYATKKANMRVEGTEERLFITELKFKRTKTKTYLYDYQMVRKGNEGFEKRILLQEDKRKKHQEDAQLKLQRFAAKYLIYGPVGFLSEYWQDHFDYKIMGEDSIEGRAAIHPRNLPFSLWKKTHQIQG